MDCFCQSRRLILRKIRESDFQDFCGFLIDQETCLMMGREIITDPASARPTFDWLKDREELGLALEERQSGRVIGNLTVSGVKHLEGLDQLSGKRGASLSFSMGRPWRRQGLMEEALRAVIETLFARGYDYINCGNFHYNTASAALQKKLGFKPLLRQTVEVEGVQFRLEENILWKGELT